jgi:hypothetical protein
MQHQIHRIIDCLLLPPYSLKLKFSDGLTRVIDLERVLEGEIYGSLRDPIFFSKVMIDPEVQTVIWPNGADFDPAVLHDWPLHSEAFEQAAKLWKQRASAPAYTQQS